MGLKSFSACGFLHALLWGACAAHALTPAWNEGSQSAADESQVSTPVLPAPNSCCVCFHDYSDERFGIECSEWLAAQNGCAAKVEIPFESLGETCWDQLACPNDPALTQCQGKAMRVYIAAHNNQWQCAAFVKGAAKLCVNYGSSCGDFTHSGCFTFRNYPEALQALREIQEQHPGINLRITANQCGSYAYHDKEKESICKFDTTGGACTVEVQANCAPEVQLHACPAEGAFCGKKSPCERQRCRKSDGTEATMTCCTDNDPLGGWTFGECSSCNGACCVPYANYSGCIDQQDKTVDLSQRRCEHGFGGEWHPGRSCSSPDTLECSFGACCYFNRKGEKFCSNALGQKNCEDLARDQLGDDLYMAMFSEGKKCKEVNCELPVGACCVTDTCTRKTECGQMNKLECESLRNACKNPVFGGGKTCKEVCTEPDCKKDYPSAETGPSCQECTKAFCEEPTENGCGYTWCTGKTAYPDGNVCCGVT